ncbi:MAG TPA: beta-propeller fold lactonase family protein, partial [Ktedonobacteraceae bacterium]
ANGFTLHAGEMLNLSVQPTLPPDTLYRWITLPANQGTFSPTNDRPSVTFTAGTTGILNIKVDALRRQHIASGTMTLQVGPADLADGASIGADGTQGVDGSSAGTPDDAFFHPAYLITHNDARVTYGNDINTRRMQLSVGQHLDQLLALLTNSAVGSQLQLVQAYTPGTGDLFQVGRAITIQHPTLAPGSLGVMAHAAGFTYVHRQGNQILLRQQADDLVGIQKLVGSGLTPVPVTTPQEIMQQQTINLEVSPRAVPHGIAVGTNFIYVANSGTDTVSEIDPATGLVRRALKVGWGPVAIVLSPDGTRLYTADGLGGSVTALDLASGNILKIIPARPGPVALAHHPTNQRLYVICQADNSLLEIDTGALTVLNTPLAVGISPTGIVLTPDGTTIWVTLNGANQVNIVSTISPLASVSTIALTKAPLKIALSPDGTRAYVTQPLDGSIVFLNVASRSVVMTISTGASGTSSPSAIAVASDNSAIYVTDTTAKNERLLLLKPADGSSIAAIRIQQEPLDLAGAVTSIDATIGKQQYVMVASRDGDIVSVIDPLKMHIANTWRIGSGLGEALNWILRMPPTTGAHLSNASAPQVNLTGDSVGPGLVRAVYAQRNNPNSTVPYTFDVRLKPTLENASTTIIRKEQYDLIMNILNAFHPVGVEVTTSIIRDRVIEVKGQLRNAFPGYTYPNFRVRGPLPHRNTV